MRTYWQYVLLKHECQAWTAALSSSSHSPLSAHGSLHGFNPIRSPLNKQRSWSSVDVLSIYRLLLFAWSLNCLRDSGTRGLTLGCYPWLPLPRLSELLSHCWAGCQSQAWKVCKAQTHKHTNTIKYMQDRATIWIWTCLRAEMKCSFCRD